MKFVVLPTLGIVGGLVFGSYSLSPFLASATSSGERHIAQKPLLPSLPEDLKERETAADCHPGMSAEDTLRQKIELLEAGAAFLNARPAYTAKIHKQEVVHGELLDEQTIQIKCRQKPFSVYLLWETGDVGREVIYIDGRNDGKMIAHDGGWKSRIPAFTLPIDCSLAMRDARYPVTKAGIMGLIDTMLEVHRDDLAKANFASCEVDCHREVDGRPCLMFTTKYKSANDSPIYRKSVTLIDEERKIPLRSQHFEWPRPGTELPDDKLDEATLLESYVFTDLDLGQSLSEADFDRNNSNYRFH